MTADSPSDVEPLRGTALGISYELSGSATAVDRLAGLLPPAGRPGAPRLLLRAETTPAATGSVSVRTRWLDGTAPDGTAPDGTVQVATDDEAEALLAALNETVLRWCEDLTLHAGVLLGREGAVAFPGASGLGKTTLVTACLRAGPPRLHLLSDEALCLTPDGHARPYPRPLALDARSCALLGLPAPPAGRELLLPPDAYGPLPPPGPHPVRAVLLPQRRPGPVELTRASAGEAVHALLTRSFNHFRDPARAVRSVTAAASGAECLHVRYEDAGALAEVLSQRYGCLAGAALR
ncbi:MAG TPA: hypothetical protein VFS29_08395 [Motilibacteraceae bacterium]|nr:hypothetical protein [Motilibacteraceae bacterium]